VHVLSGIYIIHLGSLFFSCQLRIIQWEVDLESISPRRMSFGQLNSETEAILMNEHNGNHSSNDIKVTSKKTLSFQ
jgi:hypothetical protein